MSAKNRKAPSLRTRLTIWWYAFFDRRAFRTRDFIFAASAIRLREHHALPQLGEDEAQDHRVQVAVERFFSWAPDADRRTPVDEYGAWLESDSISRANRQLHYRIQYWLHSFTNDRPKIAASHKHLYGGDIEEIEEAEILTEYYRLRKELKVTRDRYLQSIAVRLPLSIKDLAYTAPFLSFLLVLGGYFYTSRVHNHFGIGVHHFFTISDYLSSSVNAVEAASVSAVAAAAGAVWRGVNDANLAKVYRKQRDARNQWIRGLLLLASIFVLILSDEADRTTVWFAIALCLIGVFFVELLFDHVLRPSLALTLLSMSTVVFAATLYVRSNSHILNIENGVMDGHFRVTSQDSQYTSDAYSIIGTSEKYVFLWQREQDRVHILPRDDIRWVSFSDRNE